MINIKTNVKKRITFDDIGSTTSFGKKKDFFMDAYWITEKKPWAKNLAFH